jgi:hypothetical protein
MEFLDRLRGLVVRVPGYTSILLYTNNFGGYKVGEKLHLEVCEEINVVYQNKSKQTSMPSLGFEPMISVLERARRSRLRPRGRCDWQQIIINRRMILEDKLRSESWRNTWHIWAGLEDCIKICFKEITLKVWNMRSQTTPASFVKPHYKTSRMFSSDFLC